MGKAIPALIPGDENAEGVVLHAASAEAALLPAVRDDRDLEFERDKMLCEYA